MPRSRLRPYARHLYRDRRRLAVAALLFTATIWLGQNTLPDPIPMVPGEILAAIPIFAAIPLVTLWLPKWRHWIEITLTAIVVYIVLAQILPGSVFDYTGPHGYTLPGIAAFIGTVVVTRLLLYGTWSDLFKPRGTVTLTATLRSRLDRRRIWYGLVPTPGQLALNPDPEVVSIDYADAGRRTVRLVTWVPPQGLGETLIHVDELQPLRTVRFRMRVVTGIRDAAIEGTTTITLSDHGDARWVMITHEVPTLVPRRMLRGWMDDRLGRMMDARLDALENSPGPGRVAPAVTSVAAHFIDTETVQARDTASHRPPPRLGRRIGEATRDSAIGPRHDARGGFRTAYGRELTAREAEALSSVS